MMDMMVDHSQTFMTNNEYRMCSIFRSFQLFSVEVLLCRSEMILGGLLQVTVHPMLRDRCTVCLPVTLVYCGQTVGWIKMPFGMEVDLSPGYIVLDGDPAPPTEGAPQPPPPLFGPYLLWSNGRPSQQLLISACSLLSEFHL